MAGVLTAVLGGVWLALGTAFWSMGLLDYHGFLENSTTRQSQMEGLLIGTGGGSVLLLVGVVSLIGGIGVARLAPWARGFGIVAGFANILSCGCLVSLGVGIWLLALLWNPRVVSAFSRRGPAPSS